MEYILLKALFENKNNELDHLKLYKLVEKEIDFENFKKLLTSFHKRSFFDNSKNDFLISNIGISYFNILKAEKKNDDKENKLKQLINKISVGNGIVTLIFVPLTFMLGVITYSDKTKITELESEIERQSKIIDNIKSKTPEITNKLNDDLNKNLIIDTINK